MECGRHKVRHHVRVPQPRVLERHADARGDRLVRRERGRAHPAPRSASRSSTTTARSGARSRSRSSSTSSCAASPETAEADESLRGRQPWKAAYENDMRLARRGDGQALQGRRRRHEAAHRGGVASAFAELTRRGLPAAAADVPRERAAPDARPPLPRVRLRADGRAAALPRGATASRPTSPRAATATSCGRSRRALRHPARARDRLEPHARLRRRRARRLVTAKGLDVLRRRAEKPSGSGAGSVVGPLLARRQLERRHPDAALRRRRRRQRCGCSSATTTASARSPTTPAPRKRSARASRSSRSRTTGARCSASDRARHGRAAIAANGCGPTSRSRSGASCTAGRSSTSPRARSSTFRPSDTLGELIDELEKDGIELRLANVREPALEILDRRASRGGYTSSASLDEATG